MAKFKLDENLPLEVPALLKSAGHDVYTVFDQQSAGSPDFQVADACRREARAILTLDLDISDTRAYPPGEYAGIVVLRLARLDKDRIVSTIRRLLATFNQESLVGKLWIVSESSVRIRG